MSKKEENKRDRVFRRFFYVGILLSLVFHSIFLAHHLSSIDYSKFAAKRKIKIVLKTKIVERKKPDEKNTEKRQIVTTEKSQNLEKPKETRFLSEKDQSVDRQTVAKKIGSFKNAGKGTKNALETKSAAKKQGKRKVSLADLAVGEETSAEEMANTAGNFASLGLENGAQGKTGLSQNNDYVDDLPLSDMSKMNTIEYKYYGFYYRIKQKLEQYWGNSLRNKATALFKSGRRLPASQDIITSLTVTIDHKGAIKEIAIKTTSGIRELDDAAIESFNRAGPFPNPPSGMLKDGLAKIEWGFVVKS